MPIIAGIIVILLIGAGAFFLTTNTEDATEPEETPGEELVEDTDATKEDDGEAVEKESDDGSDNNGLDETEEAQEPSEEETSGAEASSTYADGTYEAQETYRTPKNSTHTIDVSITLENDVIVAADVVYDGGEGYGNNHHKNFDNGYEAEVIGKDIDSVNLGRVGGSSLTPAAFNDALAQVKDEALN